VIGNSWFIIASNIIYVLIVLYFITRMLRAASVFNWNPGRNDIQQAQKMKILIGIVTIAAVGIIAALTNILFG
jgi:hypothetical protein